MRQSFNQIVAEPALRLKQVRQHNVHESKLSIELVSCASANICARDDTGRDQTFERMPGGRLLQPQPGCNLVAAQAPADRHKVAQDLNVDPAPQYVYRPTVAPFRENREPMP